MAEDKGPQILTSMWTTTAIATCFVILRLYVRMRFYRIAGLDDFFIGVSMLTGWIFIALTTAAVRAGNGKHASSLTPMQLKKAALLNTAGFAPGIVSFVVPKLAVTALLIRLLRPSVAMRRFLWWFVGLGGGMILGCIVIIFAQCTPLRASWTPSMKHSCWNPAILINYSIAAGALSGTLDLFLAVYPATVVWNLQMSQRKKVTVTLALGLGATACVVAIYKCTRLPELGDAADFTYGTADLVIWTNIESNTIIIGSCIPTLAPLWERLSRWKTPSARARPSVPRGRVQTDAEGGPQANQMGAIPLPCIVRTDRILVEFETPM